jgi:hypothetical protein
MNAPASFSRLPSLLALLATLAGGPGSGPRAAEPEKLPAPAAKGAADGKPAAGKPGDGQADAKKEADGRKAADDGKAKPARLDRAVVYRYDPIHAKLVAVPAAEIKKDHVYYRYSPSRGRHVWSKAAGQGRFLYTLGPGSVQPARLFDIRATDEEKRRALESRAPSAAKLFATQGAQPALRLGAADEWKLAAVPADGSVFDLETARRFEWHGDRMVEVVHSGGNSWSRRGDRYVPAGAVRSVGW